MKLFNILKAALFTPAKQLGVTGKVTRWGLPFIVVGEPGVGKSDIVESIADLFDLPCEVLSPGERGEAAFGAVPVPLQGKDGVIRMTYPAPEYVSRMDEEHGGIIFIDEANTGGVALQPPLMGLIHARRIGGTVLNARVRVGAAINPVEIAPNATDFAPPIANRFGWFKWQNPTAEEHRNYMMGTAVTQGAKRDAKEEEERVLDLWGVAFAEARGIETSFLLANETWKNMCPTGANSRAASKAWPSDRSWENACRALAGAKVHQLDDADAEEFVTAFIGAKAAEQFFEFKEKVDLPNTGDLLDGKVKFTYERDRLDRMAAIINSCQGLLTAPHAVRKEARAEKFWEILDAVGAASQDIVLPAQEALIMAGLHQGKVALRVMAKTNGTLNAVNAVVK